MYIIEEVIDVNFKWFLLFKVYVDNILIKFIWEEGQLNSNVAWSLDVIL